MDISKKVSSLPDNTGTVTVDEFFTSTQKHAETLVAFYENVKDYIEFLKSNDLPLDPYWNGIKSALRISIDSFICTIGSSGYDALYPKESKELKIRMEKLKEIFTGLSMVKTLDDLRKAKGKELELSRITKNDPMEASND